MGVTLLVEAARQKPPRGVEADPQAATQVNPYVASLPSPLPPGGGEMEAPSLSNCGEGWYAPSRDRRPVEPLEGYGPRMGLLLPEVRGSGRERLPGVAGVACGQGVRGAAWETQREPPIRRGNHVQRGTRSLGVGRAQGSGDGRDSITLHERRGQTSTAPLGKEGPCTIPTGVRRAG